MVDGQQRIISIANALHPDGASDPRFALAYDLRGDSFVPLPSVEEPTLVPLPVIFDLTRVLRWFATHPEAADQVEQANELTRTIRQFRIPAYEVTQDDPKVMRDIFDRMNNYGKRLSRAEIFSGLFPGEEEKRDTRLTLDRIAQNLDDDLGFGLVDNNTVSQAVLARRGPDVMREVRNEFGDAQKVGLSQRGHQPQRAIIDFPDEDRDTAYALGEEAMRRAVVFLQTHAGVPHISFLPYRHLLVVLTRLFAHHPAPDDRSMLLLRRWFWRAAVVGPEVFRGSTTGAIRLLNFAVKPESLTGSIDELLRFVDRQVHPLPDLQRFRSNEAATKIILCSWWALEPRSLTTGEPFERADLSDCLQDRQTALDAVRYVVSRYSVPRDFRLWAADRILLPSVDSESNAIDHLLMRPRRADTDAVSEQAWTQVLASHSLDAEMVNLVRRGATEKFLKIRHQVLDRQLRSFLEQRCEWGFEDTPSLAGLVFDDDDHAFDEVPDDALF